MNGLQEGDIQVLLSELGGYIRGLFVELVFLWRVVDFTLGQVLLVFLGLGLLKCPIQVYHLIIQGFYLTIPLAHSQVNWFNLKDPIGRIWGILDAPPLLPIVLVPLAILLH